MELEQKNDTSSLPSYFIWPAKNLKTINILE
jgi:hypothetical protein